MLSATADRWWRILGCAYMGILAYSNLAHNDADGEVLTGQGKITVFREQNRRFTTLLLISRSLLGAESCKNSSDVLRVESDLALRHKRAKFIAYKPVVSLRAR
jgi:hypothetical protein